MDSPEHQVVSHLDAARERAKRREQRRQAAAESARKELLQRTYGAEGPPEPDRWERFNLWLAVALIVLALLAALVATAR